MALLDLMRQNEAVVQENLGQFEVMLQRASKNLQILDPERGVEELIESVAAELAKLTTWKANNSERQQDPGGA